MNCCPNPLPIDGCCAACGAGTREVQPKRGGRRKSATAPDVPPVPAYQVRPALENVELVELIPSELKYIGRVAAQRLSAKLPGTNKLESVTGTHSAGQLHRMGVTVKFAFSKAFGLEFDTSAGIKGDRGFDTTLPDGRTVRIKSRDRTDADLIAAVNEIVADVVVLAIIVTPDVVRFAGWLARDEFYANAWTKDFGHGQRQIVRQKKLHPMLELLRPPASAPKADTLQGRLI